MTEAKKLLFKNQSVENTVELAVRGHSCVSSWLLEIRDCFQSHHSPQLPPLHMLMVSWDSTADCQQTTASTTWLCFHESIFFLFISKDNSPNPSWQTRLNWTCCLFMTLKPSHYFSVKIKINFLHLMSLFFCQIWSRPPLSPALLFFSVVFVNGFKHKSDGFFQTILIGLSYLLIYLQASGSRSPLTLEVRTGSENNFKTSAVRVKGLGTRS